MNTDLSCVGSGWLLGENNRQITNHLQQVITEQEKIGNGKVAIGIDAPRIGRSRPRKHYWGSGHWRIKTQKDKGYGRHCEVVIKALNIANPQWTPLKNEAPDWMLLGFDLFEAVKDHEHVFEVFPSASYSLLGSVKQPTISLSFANFQPGPKDMLDACIGALTVHEFIIGRGSEVGDGDGMGSIILPTPLPVPDSHPVLKWPGT